MIIAGATLISATFPAHPVVVSHHFEIVLSPDDGHITVLDHIEVPQSLVEDDGSVKFSLNGAFRLSSIP